MSRINNLNLQILLFDKVIDNSAYLEYWCLLFDQYEELRNHGWMKMATGSFKLMKFEVIIAYIDLLLELN